MRKKVLLLITFLALPVAVVLGYLHFFFGKGLPVKDLAQFIYRPADGIDLHFYGTSCFYIGYKGKGILTDPFFSNPGPVEAFLALKPDVNTIAVVDTLWEKIGAIIVGHSHYDHCLELVHCLQKAGNDVRVVGNNSLKNQFAFAFNRSNYVNADSAARFIYTADKLIRIYPVLSYHSPHFGNTILADGENLQPFKKLPGNWMRMKCGNNYSFILDFMEVDSIAKRIFVKGGENAFPRNADEMSILAEKEVDLLISPFWDAKVMEERIKKTQEIYGPTEIVFCHWNNFFRPFDRTLQYISKSRLAEGLPQLQKKFPGMKLFIAIPEHI